MRYGHATDSDPRAAPYAMNDRAIAYPTFWRIVAAVLVAVSRGSALVLLAVLMGTDSTLNNPLRMIRAFAGLCVVPAVAAWLIGRSFAVRLRIEGEALVLTDRERRVEIPCDAVDHVRPWTVPLPADGIRLRLRSGQWFSRGLDVVDPVTVIGALADAGAPKHLREDARHPMATYAEAKRRGTRRWYHPVLKFPIFGLVPTLPVFRLHQWVAYGGTFGEYYAYGLRAYLLGFAVYWASFTIHLVLYAAALRAIAEPVVLAGTWAAPRRAATVRRAVEIAYGLLYYGGVPVLLLRLWMLS